MSETRIGEVTEANVTGTTVDVVVSFDSGGTETVTLDGEITTGVRVSDSSLKQFAENLVGTTIVDTMTNDTTLDEYEEQTDETAIYPDELPEFVTPGLLYVALGLAEAGEVQEKVKKAIREDDPSYLNDIPAEAGDVLWYLARLPGELSAIDEVDFDGTLGDIADDNLDKLLDRKDRDVLEGEGDNR